VIQTGWRSSLLFHFPFFKLLPRAAPRAPPKLPGRDGHIAAARHATKPWRLPTTLLRAGWVALLVLADTTSSQDPGLPSAWSKLRPPKLRNPGRPFHPCPGSPGNPHVPFEFVSPFRTRNLYPSRVAPRYPRKEATKATILVPHPALKLFLAYFPELSSSPMTTWSLR
jgi:hypothetical protein